MLEYETALWVNSMKEITDSVSMKAMSCYFGKSVSNRPSSFQSVSPAVVATSPYCCLYNDIMFYYLAWGDQTLWPYKSVLQSRSWSPGAYRSWRVLDGCIWHSYCSKHSSSNIGVSSTISSSCFLVADYQLASPYESLIGWLECYGVHILCKEGSICYSSMTKSKEDGYRTRPSGESSYVSTPTHTISLY